MGESLRVCVHGIFVRIKGFDGLIGQTSLLLADLLASEGALALADERGGLVAHDTTTPCLADSRVVVESGLHVVHHLLQFGGVLLLDVGDGNTGCGLFVDQVAQASLALDNTVRNVHLTAEGRHPNDLAKNTLSLWFRKILNQLPSQ